MRIVRLAYLNIHKFLLETIGTNFGQLTIVDQFPGDDLIVLPGYETGRESEVVLPAISIELVNILSGQNVEIGSSGVDFRALFAVYVHALSGGQLTDVCSFIEEAMTDRCINVYDYSGGYPGNGGEPVFSRMRFSEVNGMPLALPAKNAALRNAGIVYFVVSLIRN